MVNQEYRASLFWLKYLVQGLHHSVLQQTRALGIMAPCRCTRCPKCTFWPKRKGCVQLLASGEKWYHKSVRKCHWCREYHNQTATEEDPSWDMEIENSDDDDAQPANQPGSSSIDPNLREVRETLAKLTKYVFDLKEIDTNLREVRETLAKLTKDVGDLKKIAAQLTKDAEDLKEIARLQQRHIQALEETFVNKRRGTSNKRWGKNSKDEEASGGDQNKGYCSS